MRNVPDAICHESSEDTRPAVERVPNEGAERNLALGVPNRRQDRQSGGDDSLNQAQEESMRSTCEHYEQIPA